MADLQTYQALKKDLQLFKLLKHCQFKSQIVHTPFLQDPPITEIWITETNYEQAFFVS